MNEMEVSYEDDSVYIDDLNLNIIAVDVNNDNELSSVTVTPRKSSE